jgi:predicted MFS family arabinose efflux permease
MERRSKEPIIPLSIFNNRIVAVSSAMIFLTAGGMFGSIVFIPLFFQGVLGATATSSGNFVTPMMLGVVFGSFISGQLLSRAGGRYRIQGAFGVAIMAFGMLLLSTMTVATTNGTAVRNMVITGFGLGTTMPLYTIAVQYAVPYNILGVATSTTAFFRSIGGSVGLAVFGSVMNNRFAAELGAKLPSTVKSMIPPQQLDALMHNPQALMSPEAQNQLRGIIGQMGDQSAALLQQVLQALRESLSLSISHVFLYSFFAMVLAFIINLFLKEIPLRQHYHVGTDNLAKKSE